MRILIILIKIGFTKKILKFLGQRLIKSLCQISFTIEEVKPLLKKN